MIQKDLLITPEIITILNLVGTTARALLSSDSTDKSRIEQAQKEVIYNQAPFLKDGRSHCVQFLDWQGSLNEYNILFGETLKVPLVKAVYKCWLIRSVEFHKDAKVGDYYLLNSEGWYGGKMEFADGTVFNPVGEIGNVIVWVREK